MKILIVEENRVYAKLIKANIEKYLIFAKCEIVSSFADIKKKDNKYDLYIVNYILSDAFKDEHIRYLLNKNVKVIVMTEYEDKIYEYPFVDDIVDFIIKDDISIINYLVRLVKRIYKNQFKNVLIVDDSKAIRNYQKKFLNLLNLNVFEAKNGAEALEVIQKENINFVITDIEMPKLNGVEMVKEIRKTKKIDELPILVVSSNDKLFVTFQILKLGANDFIKKPFDKNEYIIRVNNLLDIYDYLINYKEERTIDGLTKVYNRFFLENNFERTFKFYEQKAVAMLDIDFFKKINDTYGHQTGDKILAYFAEHIKNNLRKDDLIIRYGGEEFLIFMPNTTKEEAYIILHKIKNSLNAVDGIKFTFSAGIANEGETMAEMIKIADERLYKAKKTGRDKIVYKD